MDFQYLAGLRMDGARVFIDGIAPGQLMIGHSSQKYSMRRFQYDRLATTIGDFFHEGQRDANTRIAGVHLAPKTGRYKGKIGHLVSNSYGALILRFEGKTEVKYSYVNIDLIDEQGEPIEESVTDMTGRAIRENAIICYSVAMGRSGHACEIGRVVKINPSGSITAKPIRRNGAAIETHAWSRDRLSLNANRMIVLPVDDAMVTMWLLSDFEVFRAEDQFDSED